jgi:hypothetical protein
MTDEPDTAELENRIEKLEATIEKMMPSRRDALKMGGAALVGGAAMSGTASAGTNQVGTIGSPSQPVDVESEDIDNADTVTTDTLDSSTVDNSGTVTTEDLVVNGTATGPFGGGGGIVLQSGDSITVASLNLQGASQSQTTLYDGVAKDVLGGTLGCRGGGNFVYTFDDNTTLNKNGSGTGYALDNRSIFQEVGGNEQEVDFLPPAKNVKKITVGHNGGELIGAEVILKD